jgi:putative FmdB family regulatory protein
MPIYEYRCENGHTFEVMQSMSDDTLSSCTTCNASVQRVFHPVAVHFKGSGFYTTDYGRKKSGSDASSEEGPKKKKDEKKSESKSSDSSSSD